MISTLYTGLEAGSESTEETICDRVGKLLRWLNKMSLTEYIKVEWGPLCSTAKVGNNGDMVATFRTSTEWKIDEKVLEGLVTRNISLSGRADK